jgi:hypothetical protein
MPQLNRGDRVSRSIAFPDEGGPRRFGVVSKVEDHTTYNIHYKYRMYWIMWDDGHEDSGYVTDSLLRKEEG